MAFATFRDLCVRAFRAAQQAQDRILLLVRMILAAHPDFPCFAGGCARHPVHPVHPVQLREPPPRPNRRVAARTT
jgi:hypothetical protein